MSSPFASRFNTNYCPTDDELAEIKGLLVQPRIRLQELDETIRQLQTERDKLAAHIAAHEALISPIRRIPLDMLQEIFVACLPTDRNSVMSASEAPVLLGRICSHWRTVAFQTSALWARLHIVEPQCPPWTYTGGAKTRVAAKTAQRLDVAKRWLDRSGQRPLSICFRGSDLSYRESLDTQSTLSFLRLLTSYVSRWNIIDLNFRLDIDTFAQLTQLETNSAPLLQNFTLNFPGITAPAPSTLDWTTLRFLKGSETLSECSLDHCGSNFLRIPVDWSRLTRLEIADGPLTFSEWEIVELLAECAQLQTCAVSLFPANANLIPLALPDASHIRVVELPVRNLVLGGDYSFIRHPAWPELLSLTVRDMGVPHMPQAIIRLLSSSTKLETVHLSGGIPPEVVGDILKALPNSIRNISIVPRNYPQQMEEIILTTLSSTNFGAHLEELFLENWQYLSADAILGFLRSRMDIAESNSTPASFRRFRVVYSQLPVSDVLVNPDSKVFQPFIEAGIEVTVQYPSPPKLSPFRGVFDSNGEYVF
ncbi:hypothetical protein C8F01DRAFT_1112810 [Mycena amicta]|nr:hypothetical protein C8F01DRAFT_1112810 [Mycena amicta]